MSSQLEINKKLFQMNSINNRTIILPIGEQKYNQIIDDRKIFQIFLFQIIEKYPEIFPPEISMGFSFIGWSKNVEKYPIGRRIIRLKKPFNSYGIIYYILALFFLI